MSPEVCILLRSSILSVIVAFADLDVRVVEFIGLLSCKVPLSSVRPCSHRELLGACLVASQTRLAGATSVSGCSLCVKLSHDIK